MSRIESWLRILIIGFWASFSAANAAAYSNAQLRKYYKYLYSAESSLLDGKFELACLYYDSSHRTGVKPTAVDVYNYAVCAAYTRNFDLLSPLCNQLVLKGADIMFFQRAVFQEFNASPQGHIFIGEFPKYQSQYAAAQNVETIRTIRELLDRDERMHRRPFNSREELAEFQIKDDSLAGTLLEIMLSNNCLNEEVFGANFRETLLSPWPLRDLLFRHDMLQYTDMLRSAMEFAIKSGYVKPETGLRTLVLSNIWAYGFVKEYFVINDTLKRDAEMPAETTANFNFLSSTKNAAKTKKREELFLDEPENIKKKIRYCYHQLLHESNRRPDPHYADFIFSVLPNFIPIGAPVFEPRNGIVIDVPR